jgi:hypothetical protein
LQRQRLVESERFRRAGDLVLVRLGVDEDVDRIADRVHPGEDERRHDEHHQQALADTADEVGEHCVTPP